MDTVAPPPSPAPSIPQELLEEITGCQVQSHLIDNGCQPGDGVMSTMYSVTAKLNKATKDGKSDNTTQHFIFKVFPSDPKRQTYLRTTNTFHNELSFYRVWLRALVDFQTSAVGLSKDELLIPAVPKFVGGRAIDYTQRGDNEDARYQPLDNFIVIEDVKKSEGFVIQDKMTGLDDAHLTLALTELAKLHALGWAYKNTVEKDVYKKHPFLKTQLEKSDKEGWGDIVKRHVEIAIKVMNGELGEGNDITQSINDFTKKVPDLINHYLEYTQDMEKDTWKLHRSPPKEMVDASADDKPWRLQVHGDAWSNNMMFKYNEVTGKPERVVLFDFQLSREACPTADLVYLIYTSTDSGYRKEHLDTLLQIYVDKFSSFCEQLKTPPLPGFGFDSLKRRFHRAKVIGYLMAMSCFPDILLERVEESDELREEKKVERALASELYKGRMKTITQELYDEGVI